MLGEGRGHGSCEIMFFSGACIDNHNKCSFWANNGECTKNPLWMLQKCPKSCQVCSGVPGKWVTIVPFVINECEDGEF